MAGSDELVLESRDASTPASRVSKREARRSTRMERLSTGPSTLARAALPPLGGGEKRCGERQVSGGAHHAAVYNASGAELAPDL
jgi:hypothetical protein